MFLPVLVLVPLFFFLPGYLYARLLIRDSSALSVGERWFLPIAVSVCATTWLGLSLAELGAFSLINLALVLGALCALGWVVGWKRRVPWSLRLNRPDWFWLAILALAFLLFARPAEYLTGNSDAGTYINIGANIARTGAIAIHDSQVAQLPFDSAKAFYWQLINPFMLYNAVRLPGFFIADPAQGLVLPQFLHYYPVWLAIWDALVGIPWGLYATPLIALLASISFYFLVTSLRILPVHNRRWARLAFFLLVVTVPQFWFARYPVAEVMTQFLLLTGMWALRETHHARGGAVGLAIVAGVAFGAVFLTRADAILLLAPLGVYALALVLARQWRREHWAFFGALGLVLAQALAHMLVFAPDYLYYQYSHALRMKNLDKLLPGGLPTADQLFSDARYVLLLVGVAIAGLVIVWIVDRGFQSLWTRWGIRIAGSFRRAEWRLRILAALAVIVLVILAYFVLPRPETLYAYVGGVTPGDRSANLIKLGWYLSPIGIALATVGAVVVILRDLDRHNAFFFGTAGLFTFFYLEDLYSNPHYIYTTRHYVPIVIPLLILLATRALDWLWHGGAGLAERVAFIGLARWSKYAAGGAFALWMLYNVYAMGLVDASRATGLALRLPFVTQASSLGPVRLEPFEKSIVGVHELGGAYQQVETLAKQLPSNSVIVFSAGRDEPAMLATPLQYVFGRDAFVSVFNNPPGDKIAALVDGWRAQGREVILAYGTNGGKLQLPGYALEPVGSAALDVPQWAFAYNFMPRSAWRVSLSYALFRAVPRTPPFTYPFVLDFGGDDFPYLVGGFLERAPEENTRWIGIIPGDDLQAQSAKWLTGVVHIPDSGSTSDLSLTLHARAPRDNVRLQIKSGDRVLGNVVLAPAFADYTVPLPRAALKANGGGYLIELVSQTTPDGQGRLLGAELASLRVDAP